MDLSDLLKETFNVLKSNLVLLLPTLVTAYLVPVMLVVFAILVFVPILIAASNYPNFVSALTSGAIVGGTVMVLFVIILWVGILAGQANMNKKAVLTGKTNFNDFRVGFGKYFARVLGGHIVILLIHIVLSIYILLIVLGLGVDFLVVSTTSQDLVKSLSGGNWDVGAISLMAWLDALRLMAKFTGVALGLAIVASIVYMFTLLWIQACVIEEVGALKAIRLSFSFVAKNFYTVAGYLGLYIVALGLTIRILPAGILNLSGGSGLGIPGSLEAIFTFLVTTFFTLLLYVIYADRTGKLVTARPASVTSVVFRGIKKE